MTPLWSGHWTNHVAYCPLKLAVESEALRRVCGQTFCGAWTDFLRSVRAECDGRQFFTLDHCKE